MLQSCNGLFLCESIDGDNVSRYFICNPTTKKFKMISFPRKRVKGREFYVNLAFDPLKSPHYKIISIRQVSELSYKLSYRLTYKFEMDIYWSKTDSWIVSVISFEVDAFQRIIFEEPIFCNGMIHWKCYGKKSRYFDVDKKCLQEMPMPTRRNPRFEFYRYFGEAKGTLYLALTYHDSMFLEVDVNEMASDYSNWFLKRRLNLGDVLKAFSDLKLGCLDYCPGFSGVCFIRSEKGEEPKFVVWADGIIIFYDFNDGRWEKLYDPVVKIGSRNLDFFGHLHAQRFLAYKYFENLSCI